jgi:hypothetical protein
MLAYRSQERVEEYLHRLVRLGTFGLQVPEEVFRHKDQSILQSHHFAIGLSIWKGEWSLFTHNEKYQCLPSNLSK